MNEFRNYKRFFRHRDTFAVAVGGAALVLLTLFSARIYAAPDNVFSAKEIQQLAPLLKRHDTLGITQFTADGRPRKITMAIRIAATPETVFSVFTDPSNFYYVSTLFKENTVLDEHQNAMVWSWASRHKILSVTGRNRIALYPPRRADVTIEESSVGNGTFQFLFFPDGKTHTIMLFSGFLDVNSSEWLIKFLVGNNPSMKQAMNIAIGLVVVKGIGKLAERMAQKKKNVPHRTIGKVGGVPAFLAESEVAALKPFIGRGQLFLCDSHPGGRLKQVTVVDVVNADAAKFRQDAATPQNYSKHIGAISDVSVQSEDAQKTIFSWSIGLSIFGLKSVNDLRGDQNGVTLQAVSGDLEGAYWRWQTIPLSSSRTMVAYHAFADVGRSSAILNTTVRREPYLEHGLVLGSNIVMMKAMKKVAEQKSGK